MKLGFRLSKKYQSGISTNDLSSTSMRSRQDNRKDLRSRCTNDGTLHMDRAAKFIFNQK
ncbi:hypothetical protein ANCCAN_12422, partial [Ancylostoma caninum]